MVTENAAMVVGVVAKIVILIGAISPVLWYWGLLIMCRIERNKDIKKREKEKRDKSIIKTTFSVPEYLDRIEKLSLKLQSEKESKEPYLITLRIGYDELRLNEDGSFEWIDKRPKKYVPEWDYTQPIFPHYGYTQSVDTLNYQLYNLQTQAAQWYQTQCLISALQPAPYTAYQSMQNAVPPRSRYGGGAGGFCGNGGSGGSLFNSGGGGGYGGNGGTSSERQ